MSWFGRRVGWLLTSAALLAAAPAWSQPADDATRTAARALGNSGVEAYQAGDYVTATDRLEKAYGILRVPSLGLWSARALVKNGKWIEAVDRYLEVASLQVPQGEYAVQKQAQVDAEADLAALKPKIPIVAVKTEGAPLAETQISIDGRAVPSNFAGEGRLVNPGQHVVEGRYGGQPVRVEVTLAEAQHETVVLRFSAAAPVTSGAAAAPPAAQRDAGTTSDGKTQRTLGWVAVGAGAVGVGVGTVFGIMALGKKSQLDDNPACVDDRCAPSQTDAVDAYNLRRTVSSVGFIAGGVLAGVGVVLLVTAPSQKRTAELWVSPSSAGLRGTF
jgi:hypothetical protein